MKEEVGMACDRVKCCFYKSLDAKGYLETLLTTVRVLETPCENLTEVLNIT